MKNAIKEYNHRFTDLEYVQLVKQFGKSWHSKLNLLNEIKENINNKDIISYIEAYVKSEHNAYDKFIKKEDLDNRLNVINSANTLLGVSIHLNEFGIKKYHGAQVFYSNSISESYDLALNIQKSLQYYLKNTDRSIVKRDNVYLLSG